MSTGHALPDDFQQMCHVEDYYQAARYIVSRSMCDSELEHLYRHGDAHLSCSKSWHRSIALALLARADSSIIQYARPDPALHAGLHEYLLGQGLTEVVRFFQNVCAYVAFHSAVRTTIALAIQCDDRLIDTVCEPILFHKNQLHVIYSAFDPSVIDGDLVEELYYFQPCNGMLSIQSTAAPCVLHYMVVNGEHAGKIVMVYEGEHPEWIEHSFDELVDGEIALTLEFLFGSIQTTTLPDATKLYFERGR